MRLYKVTSLALLYLVLAFTCSSAAAQDEEVDEEIEELVVLGSRNVAPRTAADSTVPIDVFNAEDLSAIGNTADITDSLRSLAPYFNASMASGDGDTFVRPTSLRGLAPDQSLVLINGKRRHRAALIAEFVPAAGKGAQGPNIGMIPNIAIAGVEILRDGAAAQYGSDAISGVVNFRMKENDEGATVRTQYGRHYDGELSFKIEGNVGVKVGEAGWASISIERSSNEALSRGIQRPEGTALLDAGVVVTGQDSPFDDKPFVQTWGRPQSEGTRLFVNSGFDLEGDTEVYFHANYAQVDGRYRFFYRSGEHPDGNFSAHSTIAALRDLGFTGLRGGFTPFFDGATEDLSLVGGLTGPLGDGSMHYDASIGYGDNTIDFVLNNTINQSLGLNSQGQPLQMDFDVGGLGQKETTFNLNLTKQVSDIAHLAGGAEWHKETFILRAGEPVSHEGAGASGFKGLSPTDAGSFSRDNFAGYVELELDYENVLTQFALRYEGFSDFGGTLNGKAAIRYNVSDTVKVRGALSTGFHAPTPGQQNIQKITTTFDTNTGGQVEQGLVPPDHPLAVQAGGAPLTEETASSLSVGFTADVGDFAQLTADFYQIDVDDRIYKTQTIPVTGANGVQTNISFFTNALQVRSSGFDVVYTLPTILMEKEVDLSFALNFNEVSVRDQNLVNGIKPVQDADIEDIENSYPNTKIVVASRTMLRENLSMMVRANYYGPHYDERGRIDGVDGNAPTKELDATIYIDMELRLQVTDQIGVAFGLVNAFDSYVDEIGAPHANRLNVGLPYARRTAANFEGGSWYLTTAVNW